jgi:hypothetical protein
MNVAELQAKVNACRTRIVKLEAEREVAYGTMLEAAPVVRQLVLGNFDSRIAEEQLMIENFEWAIQRGGL